jgi:predicted Zn-ribbon and HTH transcriptional regulator
MYRKDLIELLHNQPASLNELTLQLGASHKVVKDDLHHLIRSLKHMPYHITISPATCRKCGFIFKKEKLHKPGKCPRCNGTWISDPLISIEDMR